MTNYANTKLLGEIPLFLVVITLPLSGSLNSIAIILLVVQCILITPLNHYKNILSREVIISFIFYLLLLIGVLHTQDLSNGIFQLEQKVSLIIFPIVFSLLPTINSEKIKHLMMLFVLSIVLSLIYCISYVVVTNISQFRISEAYFLKFLSHDLVKPIGSHATYFSMFIVLSIFILFEKISGPFYKSKYVHIFLSIFLISCLFLLAARIEIISFLLILSLFLFKICYKSAKFSKYLILYSLFMSCMFYTISDIGALKYRYSQIYTFQLNDLIGSNNENGVTQRIFFWENSIEIIKRSPLYGHGTGDVNLEFDKQYSILLKENPSYPDSIVKAIYIFSKNNYNSHNQYLQIFIMLGIIGILAFTTILIYSMIISILTRNFLHFTFLTIIIISCLTECIFDRQMGVVFFSLFNSIFILDQKKISKLKN